MKTPGTFSRSFCHLSPVTLATLEPQSKEEPSLSCTVTATKAGSAPSPQSEAVANELQELSLQPAPCLLPLRERKNVLQLKLQQRRTREELVSQGIMPPLKSPAAFHEQRRSLERARTEDYLKRKIRSRPERSELVRMHILEETSAEPSLQAKQLKLKRARLADNLNDKISHRPGPMELIHKNILPVHCSLIETEFPKGAGESSSPDEDSSDALSPDQPACHDSSPGLASLPSPPDIFGHSNNTSPTQAPPTLPLPISDVSPPQKLTNGTATPGGARPPMIRSKSTSERRSKKPKESKPKVKKLKYHQYIPPDQKAEREPPPQLDSSYAKILHQQQLFLQLQIINQQQQHYNYHTILPAPPKSSADQQPSSGSGHSPSRNGTTSTQSSSNQNGLNRQSHLSIGGTKPGTLPPNLDDFKVTELKYELKLRGLPVSGTKIDLIERLKHYQEQIGGGGAAGSGSLKNKPPQQHQSTQHAGSSPTQGGAIVISQSGEGSRMAASTPFMTGGAQTGTKLPIMHFGSTGSSPPVSPTPSDRSVGGMSPDETSCNGDVFGEMVSSPLTQLNLHPSPLKEENGSQTLVTCRFSQHAPQTAAQRQEARLLSVIGSGAATATSLDKDQMLQEKDKQIEALTRMLRQKQKLVETLRSQLEQGKLGGGDISEVLRNPEKDTGVKDEPSESQMDSAVLSPSVTDGDAFGTVVKEEVEEEREELSEGEGEEVWPKAQSGQNTELQIQQQMQAEQEQQKPEEQDLQPQVMQAQQRLLQNQQNQILSHPERREKTQKQTQVQSLQSGSSPSFSLDLLKTHPTPTLLTDSNGNRYLIAVTNHSAEGQLNGSQQGKCSTRITLQRMHSTPGKIPVQSTSQLASTDTQSEQHLQPGVIAQTVKKGQKAAPQVLTSSLQEGCSLSAPPSLQPFFLSDDTSGDHTPSSPTHKLMGKVRSSVDQHTLFRPLSPTPSPQTSCSKQCGKGNGSCSQPMDDLFDILMQSAEISTGLKADPDPSLSHLRPNTPPTSPAPSPNHPSPSTPREPVTTQQLAEEVQTRPSREGGGSSTGSGRLEDFLESTTGTPLIGVEPDGPLTLIDDLHSQMLSTSSILDHPPSPMDTSDLGLTPHHPGLDFGDPALDSMDWLDITMGGGSGGETGLTPLGSHMPPSIFSADFLDSSDLQLQWESCL
ncbi:myocardin-related transcription factor A-like isoform X2 [Megalops cyprinoides]|uniref:myocardin-related transcription factor A-like isoform X2 n=1 Tax=Megalops cyprinoides TaxID=118141 RepID=UPI001864829E|nr:myocardin-related transcription factor A-like isoform X2 [Megalops cyprinoides]